MNVHFFRNIFKTLTASDSLEYGHDIAFFQMAAPIMPLAIIVSLHPCRCLPFEVVAPRAAAYLSHSLVNSFEGLFDTQVTPRLWSNIKTLVAVSRAVVVNPVLLSFKQFCFVWYDFNNLKAEGIFPIFAPSMAKIRGCLAVIAVKRLPVRGPALIDVGCASNIYSPRCDMGNCIDSRDNVFVWHTLIIHLMAMLHNCQCHLAYLTLGDDGEVEAMEAA